MSLGLNLWKITRKDFVPELLLRVNPQHRVLSWILGWPDGKDNYAVGKWGGDTVLALTYCRSTLTRTLICGDLGCNTHRRCPGLPNVSRI